MVLIKLIFLSTAQEQSNIYPSHSYNTSLSPPPNSVSPPAQEDLGGPRKNEDPNMQENSVINLTTATTRDTITIHTGKATQSSQSLWYLYSLGQFCVHSEHLTCWKINSIICFYSPASSPRKIYDTRDIGHSSVTQIDFDDDKYRRRPALSWFAQILKLVS